MFYTETTICTGVDILVHQNILVLIIMVTKTAVQVTRGPVPCRLSAEKCSVCVCVCVLSLWRVAQVAQKWEMGKKGNPTSAYYATLL